MDEQFFVKYAPSELYASALDVDGGYVGYLDQNVTHIEIPFLFPSETIFKLRAFMDICRQHHADDQGPVADYEEVWVNGHLKARGGFFAGRPCGCWRFFHENGACAEVVHLDTEGNIRGEHALFYLNGHRAFSFCHQGDEATGTLETRYLDGQVKAADEIYNGRKNGICRRWHANGRLASEGLYEKGIPVGAHTYWTEDGTVILERVPVECTKVFHEKEYDARGRLKRVRSYLADHQMHGEEISYYDYERRIMLDAPVVKYYLHNKEVGKTEYFARTGGVL